MKKMVETHTISPMKVHSPPILGRSSMKHYLPKKPIKRGFKVWVRAQSATGYFSDFKVYTGITINCFQTIIYLLPAGRDSPAEDIHLWYS